MVLRNTAKLQDQSNSDHIKKIFITPDLNPKQQEENKILREKLNEMDKSGKSYRIKNWQMVINRPHDHMTQKLDCTSTYSNYTCDLINTSNHFNTQNSLFLEG